MARTDSRPHYGTKRRVRADGYVDRWAPNHPLARSDGYVGEHRMVAWDAGILTDPAKQVHHVNGDRSDNRQHLQVTRSPPLSFQVGPVCPGKGTHELTDHRYTEAREEQPATPSRSEPT